MTCGRLLGSAVDVASIAVFRIVYGLLCLGLCLGFLLSGFMDRWVGACDVELHWYGLSWIALPCDLLFLRLLVGAAALASVGVLLGFCFRVSAVALVGLLVWVLAADQAVYSSTFYLLVLLGLWLALSPADRAWSVDARRARSDRYGPVWPLRMLQLHVGLMYFYAAIAKLDADWLEGRPMSAWLDARGDIPWMGPLLQLPGLAVAGAWGGLAFDSLIVPALVWRRTRVAALVAMLGFHAFNGVVLHVFPLPIVAFAASLLLLEPDWPRRVVARCRRRPYLPGSPNDAPHPRGLPASVCVGLAAYTALQLVVPLRHFVYPGPVAWNEDGDEMSWRLRARTKVRRLSVHVVDLETGERRRIGLKRRFDPVRLEAIQTYPDRLLQFAHQLAADEAAAGRRVAVFVRYRVGLNGRPIRDLVDPKLDLATQPRTFLNTAWIEPPPDP